MSPGAPAERPRGSGRRRSGAAPADPRAAAHRLLLDVERGAYADRAAARRLAGLSPRDRAFALELAYGCIRLRARLDAELERLVDRPLARLDLSVLLWLRLGLHQVRELRVPDHAAVHETVEGARRTAGSGAARLVNAVLRAALRGEAGRVFPRPEEDPVGHLATWGSHPEWLVRRWLARWSAEEVGALVEADNRPPPVVVRLLADEDCDAAAARLEGSASRLEPLPGWPRSCALLGGDPAELLERLPAVVQDPAASAVVDYAGADLVGPVLDACAAPGTKAAVLAWRAAGARPYVAADIAFERLVRARRAAGRLGLDLLFVVADARRPAVREVRTALLDVPCTGTGVLRRRPDARWRLGPGRLASLVALQREILDAAAARVSPGGVLVYATCSLEPEENEEQVEDFLRRHPEFVRRPPAGPVSGVPEGALTDEGDLRVLPWRHGSDGAYAARLGRAA